MKAEIKENKNINPAIKLCYKSKSNPALTNFIHNFTPVDYETFVIF